MEDLKIKENLISLLEKVNVLCRDDGTQFIEQESPRIDVITDILKNSSYQLTKGDISLIYHRKNLKEYGDDTLLISSHIDCESNITKCFSLQKSDSLLLGTYDNSITNASLLYLMVNDLLPDNVIVSFTGDEERCSHGAVEVFETLTAENIRFKTIILDVTDAGWDENVDFTVENNFWDDDFGEEVIRKVSGLSSKWFLVPASMDDLIKYLGNEHIYLQEAELDESWMYSKLGVECFSLCIPIFGPMHSDQGVNARVDSLLEYTRVLKELGNIGYHKTGNEITF